MDLATITSALRRIRLPQKRSVRALPVRRGVPAEPRALRLPELRYEMKFAVPDPDYGLVESWVRTHSAGFRRTYPGRRVQSLYFDSPGWRNVEDNLDGVGERAKVRLRWYGESVAGVRPTLEIKIKQGGLGFKRTKMLMRTFDLRETDWGQLVDHMHDRADEKMLPYLVQSSCPTLINGYDREYFVSADRLIRLTVDRNLVAYDQTQSTRPQFERRVALPRVKVIEVKAPVGEEPRLREVLREFPATVQAFSKYAEAMLRIGESYG